MKKVISILALAAAFTVSANAQSMLGEVLSGLGGTSTGSTSGSSVASTIGNIVSGLAGTVYSAPVSLNGTYTYNGVAVSATSSEGGILANLAGTAVTSGIESKADEYLAKVGIKPGAMTWTFNSADNTFTLNVLGLSLPGTYKVGDGEKTVNLTFGKTMKYLSMTGTLESTPTGAKMLFTVDKAMTFIKKIVSMAGQASSQVAGIAKLADGYDNYRIGFKLSK
ncbi:MAG: DUF4923 family protein [Bacteroidales bacterium]|nr:DUF4923 family protein [Bacteroidales bacterium]